MKPRKKIKQLTFSHLYIICERAYAEGIMLENMKSIVSDIYYTIERREKPIKDLGK